jgi:hypothetical protein
LGKMEKKSEKRKPLVIACASNTTYYLHH